MTRTLVIISALSLALAAGCARPASGPLFEPSDPPLVWPKSPDPPRICHLGELSSSEDLGAGKSAGQVWHEILHGPTEPAKLLTPYAVAVHKDGLRVAVADTTGKCAHAFDLEKRKYTRHDVCDAAGTLFGCPVGVAWAGDDLYVADSSLHAVAVIRPSGPGQLIGRDALQHPAGLAYSPAGDLLFVTDTGANSVFVFHRDGRLVRQFGSKGTGSGEFNHPSHVACGPGGTVAVADSLNFRVQQFTAEGVPLGEFGRKGDATGDFALPKGVAVSTEGNLWVVDARFENVQGFTPQGELLLAFGGEGHGPGEFWLPAGIYVDAQQRMWVADTYNRRLQVFKLLK
ncbi:MAG: 6-bladed beta-propeller [Phycisphaerae bacterium]|nr:6-bladed beta-propeller [Phycisphaerae bacterium]